MSLLRTRAIQSPGEILEVATAWTLPSEASARVGTLRYRSETGIEVCTEDSHWQRLGSGEVANLVCGQYLSGTGTASSPLSLRIQEVVARGRFLTRVATDQTLMGAGTESSPLRVNESALSGGSGLTEVSANPPLVGRGTSADPLKLSLAQLQIRPRFATVEVNQSRILSGDDAGKILVVRAQEDIALIRLTPHPFRDGDVVKVYNASESAWVRLDGVSPVQPYWLRPGESAILISDSGNLYVASLSSFDGLHLPAATVSSSRVLSLADANKTLYVTSGSVTLSVPIPHPYPAGTSLWVVNTSEGLVYVQEENSQYTVDKWLHLVSTGSRFVAVEGGMKQLETTLTSSRSLSGTDAGKVLVYRGDQVIQLVVPQPCPLAAGDTVLVRVEGSGRVEFSNVVGIDRIGTAITLDIAVGQSWGNFTATLRQAFLVSDGSRVYTLARW